MGVAHVWHWRTVPTMRRHWERRRIAELLQGADLRRWRQAPPCPSRCTQLQARVVSAQPGGSAPQSGTGDMLGGYAELGAARCCGMGAASVGAGLLARLIPSRPTCRAARRCSLLIRCCLCHRRCCSAARCRRRQHAHKAPVGGAKGGAVAGAADIMMLFLEVVRTPCRSIEPAWCPLLHNPTCSAPAADAGYFSAHTRVQAKSLQSSSRFLLESSANMLPRAPSVVTLALVLFPAAGKGLEVVETS